MVRAVYWMLAVCVCCAVLTIDLPTAWSTNRTLSQAIRQSLAGKSEDSDCASSYADLTNNVTSLPYQAAQVSYRIAAHTLERQGCDAEKAALWSRAEQSGHLDRITALMLARDYEAQRRYEQADSYFQLAGAAMETVAHRIDQAQTAAQAGDFAAATEYMTAALRLGDAAVDDDRSLLSERATHLRQTWADQRDGILREIGWYLYHLPGRLDESIAYYELSLQEQDSAYTRKLTAMAWMGKEPCSTRAISILQSLLQQNPEDTMAKDLMGVAKTNCRNGSSSSN